MTFRYDDAPKAAPKRPWSGTLMIGDLVRFHVLGEHHTGYLVEDRGRMVEASRRRGVAVHMCTVQDAKGQRWEVEVSYLERIFKA